MLIYGDFNVQSVNADTNMCAGESKTVSEILKILYHDYTWICK